MRRRSHSLRHRRTIDMVTLASPAPGDPRFSRRTGAFIGVLSVASFLAFAEALAGFAGRSTAPVLAIGEAFIPHTPLALKEFAVRTFGTNDKAVLISGIFVVIAAIAAVVGVLSARRPWLGSAGIVALGTIAGFAAHGRPDAGVFAPLPAVFGAVAALIFYRALLRSTRPHARRESLETFTGRAMAGSPDAATGSAADGAESAGRRRFLLTSGAVAAASVAAGVVGTRGTRSGVAAAKSRDAAAVEFAARAATQTPTATASATTGTQLDVPGISPFFTRNKDFYRIDTALSVPQIDKAKWSLRIHGLVDKELRISYDDLLAMPAVEHDTTLCCVSNPVGGELISNARWTGVLLSDVLAKAGIKPDATQILSMSADGWTCGTPVSIVLDGRAAMLAYGMNGEPLPIPHGFPVRMVVPGLYGYVSATKWLTDMELTTMEAKGYWITRGWSQDGPVKTHSRIDVPNGRNPAKSGQSPIAGVAWSQHRGVDKVEVSIDNGPWLAARLAGEDESDTWRQWVYDGWQATPGSHTLRVRATDRTGYVQTGEVADVAPNGATGYHEVQVSVR